MLAALILILANPSLDSLIEAERAFARLSATQGMQTAFLENLGEGSIVFRPQPVDGRKFYAAASDSPLTLDWAPAFACVAQSGDFGYTTGPWSLRSKTPQPRPPAFGSYVSVWTRGREGRWRVAIDCGVSHPEAPAPSRVETATGAGDPAPGTKIEELFALDRRFSPSLAAPDIRVYRPGSFPLTGAAAVAELEKSAGANDVHGGAVASSGDLAYTYGVASTRGGQASCLRIWKHRAGKWLVVLEVLNPIPAQRK